MLAPTPTILDTGAGPNFVSEKVLPAEWRDFEIPRTDVTPVRSATGNPLRIKGAVPLYVQLGSYKVRIRFVVASNLSVPCIIGCNFIDRHVQAILPKEQKLTLRDESSTTIIRSSLRDVEQHQAEQPQIISRKKDRPTVSDKLRVAQTIKVPPLSETVVLVRSERSGLVFLESRPETHDSMGISLANGVTEVSPNRPFPVKVLNISHHPRVLQKNMVLGHVRPHPTQIISPLEDVLAVEDEQFRPIEVPDTKVPTDWK